MRNTMPNSIETIRAAASMICAHCQNEFTQGRAHQRFCSPRCRVKNHGDGGLRGVVSRVSKTKRGGVSVVIRFSAIEADNALSLDPGTLIEVVKNGIPAP